MNIHLSSTKQAQRSGKKGSTLFCTAFDMGESTTSIVTPVLPEKNLQELCHPPPCAQISA